MIYFIQAGEIGPIKIGYTSGKTVNGRLRSLQTASPFPLRVLLTCEGSQVEEAELHERFEADRLHGEWFEASDDLIGWIASQRRRGWKPYGPLGEAHQSILDLLEVNGQMHVADVAAYVNISIDYTAGYLLGLERQWGRIEGIRPVDSGRAYPAIWRTRREPDGLHARPDLSAAKALGVS